MDTQARLAQLEARHATVKAQSELLNQCIQRFQDWVSELPGRVETSLLIATKSIYLGFERDGRKWVVVYAYARDGVAYESITHEPLRNAGIRLKLAMLPMLPHLIESMVQSQDQLSDEITRAVNTFDEFAAVTMRKDVPGG